MESLIDSRASDISAGKLLDREGVIAAVSQMELESYEISGMEMHRLSDVEIVTYRCRVEGTYKGLPFEYGESVCTTVWSRASGRWLVVHRHESQHTDTKRP